MISPLSMIGIGMPGATELIILFLIVLVIFGPKALPSLGRAMGEGLRELRHASSKMSEAMSDMDKNGGESSSKKKEKDTAAPRKELEDQAPPKAKAPADAVPASAPSEREN